MAHILVVEDEPHIRFLICKILEGAGHTTDQAGDGLEALHMLHTTPWSYSLVISDFQMPKMDGFRLLDMLKRQPVSVPVVILTAHRNLCASAVERGASGGLAKPINRKQLVELVNRLTMPDAAILENTASTRYATAYK
ncbi:MAG: response regulator [Chloroflexota bacterium]